MKKIILLLVLLILISGCSQKEIKKSSETPETIPETGEGLERTPEGTQETLSLGNLCSSQQECVTFCQSNTDKCQAYCKSNPNNKLCTQMMGKMETTTEGCTTFEQCKVYCPSHPDEISCKEYLKGAQQQTETPLLIMPFQIEDYSPVNWGLWPFCVHGGDHPEGHGGIDIELKPDAKILSPCDGTVNYVEEITDPSYQHGEGLAITCGGIAVSYSGISNRLVNTGDKVTKGQQIGSPFKLEAGESYIHFETNNFMKELLECPLQYLDENFKNNLQQMFSQAHYPEQSSEPKLCNCETLPYKPTQLNLG